MDAQKAQGNDPADDNEISQQYSNRLIANQLTIRQGAANSIEANEVTLRQAAALRVKSELVEASGSALGLVHGQTSRIDNSTVGVVNASGTVTMDQSMSNTLVAGGDVSMDQSAAVVLVSRKVSLKDSRTVFLIAQHVDGDVTTLFNSQDALIFGVAAGLVGGLFMLLSRIFKRR